MLPSLHIARAALHVAAIVDRRGSLVDDAQESYWHHATGGTFAPVDLDRGERLLIDVGLLVDVEGTLMPAPELANLLAGTATDALAALSQRVLVISSEAETGSSRFSAQLAELIPDAARREEILLALARRFDDAQQQLIGEIGEEIVVSAARSELVAMGRSDLARAVRRVSLISDQLGYDVSAPRVVGADRLLEVKATTVEGPLRVYLSRNEADTGATFSDWALVVCTVEDVDQRAGRVIGWRTAAALMEVLPVDGAASRWEKALVEIPVERLVPGLPGVAG